MAHQAVFSYSCAGADTLYDSHDNQECEILRRAIVEETGEDDIAMFAIRWKDGQEGFAWGDELTCLHDGVEDASDCPVAAAYRDIDEKEKQNGTS